MTNRSNWYTKNARVERTWHHWKLTAGILKKTPICKGKSSKRKPPFLCSMFKFAGCILPNHHFPVSLSFQPRCMKKPAWLWLMYCTTYCLSNSIHKPHKNNNKHPIPWNPGWSRGIPTRPCRGYQITPALYQLHTPPPWPKHDCSLQNVRLIGVDTVDGINPATLGCTKPCKSWDNLPINWRRTSIKSITSSAPCHFPERTNFTSHFRQKLACGILIIIILPVASRFVPRTHDPHQWLNGYNCHGPCSALNG